MKFEYSETKDLILKQTRKIGFEAVLEALSGQRKLDDLSHTNLQKYPNQKLFIVEINGYAYVVPYVIDKKRKVIFLKTIYPSKKLTKKYLSK